MMTPAGKETQPGIVWEHGGRSGGGATAGVRGSVLPSPMRAVAAVASLEEHFFALC